LVRCPRRFTDECETSILSYPKEPNRCCEISSDKLTDLTGTLNGASVTLYATLGTAAGNALVTFTDTAAFDADISAAPFSTLVNAAANTVFRGVAFAPDSNQ